MIQEPTPKVSKAFEAQQAVTSGFRFRRGSVLRKKPTGKPTGTEGADAVLTESLLAKEVHARQAQAHAVVVNMRAAPTAGVGKVYAYIPAQLENAVFCGHLVTDLDSIAGALGAACLYGGTPARASEVNSETAFALDLWGVNPPEQIESIVASMPDVGICLVDHQQKSQLNPSIAMDKIVGIIDHHALQSQTIVTDKPIYIDIRPWGSMSTIIAHQFMVLSIRPEVHLAGMLLCAILSDTLNLLGPTTTEWDRTMVALLAEICAIDDVQGLAQRQFKAKSKELGTLSANQLVNGDLKEFVVECHGETVKVGFAVIETTDDEVILAREEELIEEIDDVRNDRCLKVLFLAVVHIVELKSKLLCAGPAEASLAATAFQGAMLTPKLMDLGARVSRKKEFVPPITSAVAGGWKPPEASPRSPADRPGGPLRSRMTYIDPTDPYGRIQRKRQSHEDISRTEAEDAMAA